MQNGKLYPIDQLSRRIRGLFKFRKDSQTEYNCSEITVMLQMYLYMLTGTWYEIHEAELKMIMSENGFKYQESDHDFEYPDFWNISPDEAKRLQAYCSIVPDESLQKLMNNDVKARHFILSNISRCAERIWHPTMSTHILKEGATGILSQQVDIQFMLVEHPDKVVVYNLSNNLDEPKN